MSIKQKKEGPKPNPPTFQYEWQDIAYNGDVDKAVAAFRRRYSYAPPSEAMRAVKDFMVEHKVKKQHA